MTSVDGIEAVDLQRMFVERVFPGAMPYLVPDNAEYRDTGLKEHLFSIELSENINDEPIHRDLYRLRGYIDSHNSNAAYFRLLN